jgi:hypothetical protein
MNDDDYEQRKQRTMRAILGESKMKYITFIEQLLFMEQSQMC